MVTPNENFQITMPTEPEQQSWYDRFAPDNLLSTLTPYTQFLRGTEQQLSGITPFTSVWDQIRAAEQMYNYPQKLASYILSAPLTGEQALQREGGWQPFSNFLERGMAPVRAGFEAINPMDRLRSIIAASQEMGRPMTLGRRAELEKSGLYDVISDSDAVDALTSYMLTGERGPRGMIGDWVQDRKSRLGDMFDFRRRQDPTITPEEELGWLASIVPGYGQQFMGGPQAPRLGEVFTSPTGYGQAPAPTAREQILRESLGEESFSDIANIARGQTLQPGEVFTSPPGFTPAPAPTPYEQMLGQSLGEESFSDIANIARGQALTDTPVIPTAAAPTAVAPTAIEQILGQSLGEESFSDIANIAKGMPAINQGIGKILSTGEVEDSPYASDESIIKAAINAKKKKSAADWRNISLTADEPGFGGR
tara:strand:- start:457 stop:1725 length:1269 start_codon:yes stop_codon:yes gene_type:complete